MAIPYHPDLGEALWCDYSGIKPEMVKRRLAVVLTPRSCQRIGLATVIPISCTPPDIVRPWHVRLSRDPYPKGDKSEVWAKCDMVNVVSFERLSGYHVRWNGRRKYLKMRVSLEEFTQIRTGLLASLGLADRLPETADGRFL
jgi:uncharacterized protein YifN (PemK superfamily)